MNLDLRTELGRTEPDFVVYVPRSLDGSSRDTGNEHFLVFDGPDGSLMAVWTQSSYEGASDQRVVFAGSRDEGRSWSAPVTLAARDQGAGKGMASWGFPLVSRSGRIYVIYSRHVGRNDVSTHVTGLMACTWSDDAGRSWAPESIISMPRSIWDNPDPACPANWIVWQKPLRLSEGKYLVGCSRWVSPVLRERHPDYPGSLVELLRFENLDDDPPPSGLEISWLHSDDRALKLSGQNLEEMTLAPLPDGRLFAVMRSSIGGPCWSVSSNHGIDWSEPRRLLYRDGGEAVKHPLSPCPLYCFEPGRYFMFIHNHAIQTQLRSGADHRRPICLLHGEYRPGAEQPVWFSAPRVFMDSHGIQIGHPDGGCNAGMSMYSSLTQRHGRTVLWYPERKFFLLGREITREMLAELPVPP